ncbi:MAG: hypothetical protein WCC26_13580 [Terracidiphilus sp.]
MFAGSAVDETAPMRQHALEPAGLQCRAALDWSRSNFHTTRLDPHRTRRQPNALGFEEL